MESINDSDNVDIKETKILEKIYLAIISSLK